jgi:iron complex transport system substrate-binding protein
MVAASRASIRDGRGVRRSAVGALAALALALSSAACTGDGATDTAPVAAPAPLPVAPAAQPDSGGGSGCPGPASVAAPPTVEPISVGATPALPTTVTDVTGKQFKVTSAERILAVGGSGTLATTVYALGLGDRLVGRDHVTMLPELAHLPVVTVNAHELSGEAMLGLNPDLVLAEPTAGPPEVLTQLERSGIPVVRIATPPAAAAIAPQIKEVAAVFGRGDLGDRLADRVLQELAAVQQRVAATLAATKGERLRMAFLYLRGNRGVYVWLGAGSGADELIRSLDGHDIAEELRIPSRTPLTAEAIVAAQPQLILVMTSGLESVGGVEGLRSVVGIGETEAGRGGCVIDLPDHLALAFGPMYPKLLDSLVSAVHERTTRA